MATKRTLDSFFQVSPKAKKPRISEDVGSSQKPTSSLPPSNHSTYPFPVPNLPPHIDTALSEVPASEGKAINDQVHLDLLYFQPYIPRGIAKGLFEFLRSELFFYRVQYKIKRGPVETMINTPRYTTVFGVDETSRFTSTGSLIDAQTSSPIPIDRYGTCRPRPLPACLDTLRQLTEVFTESTYNFCLVNYYATGADSISYHSDDERFLGPDPAIASFSLGAKRDFLMKHKPPATPKNSSSTSDTKHTENGKEPKPLKLELGSGDMILMRGTTQANWLHSIPKRKGGEADRGRINITFRKAMVRGGTENYYQYNVGTGGVWKWDDKKSEMMPWTKSED